MKQNTLVESPHNTTDTTNGQVARTIGYVGLALSDSITDLLSAAIEARDWMRRSCRIDDQEQADDLNEAITKFEASRLNNSESNTAQH